ncbi:MAG: hypothetical protein H6624_09555 [Bdellovibrionaceae bacterium]|nr:hypothetical protein [Pseudobdellovibrionaceae bacterium]
MTTAHTFRSIDKSRRLSDREIREFRFYSKVWIPEEMRRNKNEAYEFREYEIESVEFGGSDERNRPQEDYAFVKLKERVGQTVSPMDSSGREIRSNRRRVADDKLVRPLPFKKFDRKQVPNIGMGVGFQKDKGWEPQKNCQPFAIHDPPNGHRMGQYPGTIIVEADTNGMSSGMAYSLLVDGEPHFAGVNVGFYPDRTSLHGQFDIWNRFNWGIESNSIYDHFMEFRRKWGRN